MREVFEANKLLKINGGSGDGETAIVGGYVRTIRESVVTQIARDICDDAVRRQYPARPLRKIPLAEILEGIDARVKGRLCTANEVAAEVGRIYNAAYRLNK